MGDLRSPWLKSWEVIDTYYYWPQGQPTMKKATIIVMQGINATGIQELGILMLAKGYKYGPMVEGVVATKWVSGQRFVMDKTCQRRPLSTAKSRPCCRYALLGYCRPEGTPGWPDSTTPPQPVYKHYCSRVPRFSTVWLNWDIRGFGILCMELTFIVHPYTSFHVNTKSSKRQSQRIRAHCLWTSVPSSFPTVGYIRACRRAHALYLSLPLPLSIPPLSLSLSLCLWNGCWLGFQISSSLRWPWAILPTSACSGFYYTLS